MTKTTLLLHRWYDGDQDAHEELIERHQDWILARVRKRLGQKLRQKLESSRPSEHDAQRETLVPAGPVDSCRLLRFEADQRQLISLARASRRDATVRRRSAEV